MAEDDVSQELERMKEEKEKKRAEVRARLAAEAESKKKKGFMTPARKKKLRTLLRKKAAEELKKEQERKAAIRKETINERLGEPKSLDGMNEAELIQICRDYYERVVKLENEIYDTQFSVRHKEYQINEISMVVNDMRGKFIKPPLKKVSRFEYGKFEKLMRAAKKGEQDFLRHNLKQVEKPKFKLEDEPKEAKPDWALGAKKEETKAEE